MLENERTVRGVYEALAAGNFTVLEEALHEGVEWHAADHPPYFGPQAVLTGLAGILRIFDDFAVDVRRIVGAGNTVLVEGRFRATGRVTGKVLDAQVAHVWDFLDGRIVRFQQYTDTWQMAEVTGVSPSRRGAPPP